jgi:hypothetical protein
VIPAPDRLRAHEVHAAEPAIEATEGDAIGVADDDRSAGVGQGDRASR